MIITHALAALITAPLTLAPDEAAAIPGALTDQDLTADAATEAAAAALTFGDIVAITFILIGVVFSAISAIGIQRMPDIYTRMQAAAKAGTLGIACIIGASAAHFAGTAVGWQVAVEVLLILVFVFLTTPAAAHLIARAAYVSDADIWEGMKIDELEQCYSCETQRLRSEPVLGENTPAPAVQDAQPNDEPPAEDQRVPA